MKFNGSLEALCKLAQEHGIARVHFSDGAIDEIEFGASMTVVPQDIDTDDDEKPQVPPVYDKAMARMTGATKGEA